MLGNEKGNQENTITYENYLSKDGDLMCGQEGSGEGNWQGIRKVRAYLFGGLNLKGLVLDMDELTQRLALNFLRVRRSRLCATE